MTDILQRLNVGIAFFEINGTGSTPRELPEIVHS